MTVVSMQNYGVNSYMIQQPFDFAGRTGKIVFDVDAVPSGLGAFVAVEITEDPVPAPAFQEFGNFETGAIPRNGVMLKLIDDCQANSGKVRLGALLIYNNYLMTLIENPSFVVGNGQCPLVKAGSLNHFEIRLSQNHIDVYGSDYSSDGVSFPAARLIYSAEISVPFSRGYVRMAARNHATLKYLNVPIGIFHWDNIGFDGPVISGIKMYEVADNTKIGTYQVYGTGPVMQLGYMLSDGTNRPTAGLYDPDNIVAPLQIPRVDLTGSTKARITLNAFMGFWGPADATWGLKYRVNGSSGTWHTHFLTPEEVKEVNGELGNPSPGSNQNVLLSLDLPISELKNGTNTVEFLPAGLPMAYAPVIANINLVLSP